MYFVGGYDKEEKAARAYDLAALKYWGTTTTTNFPVSFHFFPFSFNFLLQCTLIDLRVALHFSRQYWN